MVEKITITGDTTREELENIINNNIQQHGKDCKIEISKNLKFEDNSEEE